MAKNLITLIKASGFGGLAGQSFRNHVSGAINLTKMTDYLIPNMSTSNVPDPQFQYPKSQSFTVNFRLPNKGGSGSTIQQLSLNPNWNIQILQVSGTTYQSSAELISLGTWSSNKNTGSVTFKMTGSIVGTASVSASVKFFSTPTVSDTERLRFTSFISPSLPGGAYSIFETLISYDPDIGPFNDRLYISGSGQNGGMVVSMSQRPVNATDYLYEWHGNSSYSGTPSSSQFEYITGFISDPGETHRLWLRTRPDTGSSWNNYGSVTWFDYR